MLCKTEGYLIRYLGHPTLRHLLLEWAHDNHLGSGNIVILETPSEVDAYQAFKQANPIEETMRQAHPEHPNGLYVYVSNLTDALKTKLIEKLR